MTVWRNWGRSVLAHPASIENPCSETEVAALLDRAAADHRPVRAVGAGHSFTPIAATSGVLVRLDALSGVRRVDGNEVTLGAGTRLHDLPHLLRPYGLALQNMGDIDAQTVAGAISTGTHGTGATHPGIAAQVTGLRIVLADGSVADCSALIRPDLFQAARIGLGAFGILTEVTVRCVPAFLLAADEHPQSLASVLEDFDEIASSADHVEFYWFPHTETALVKSNTRLPIEAGRHPQARWRAQLDDEVLSNGVFALTCGLGWLAPQLVPTVNRAAARLVSVREFTDDSYAVFTSPRRVRFREMEFSIDRDALPEAIGEIRALIKRKGWRISFPLEIRVAAADDVWLSTAYGRPSAYIAVHRYYRDPFAEYFLAVQGLLLAFGGRPHWGKLHSLGVEQLRSRYPRFDDALAVRDAVDPDRRFTNAYLDRILGS